MNKKYDLYTKTHTSGLCYEININSLWEDLDPRDDSGRVLVDVYRPSDGDIEQAVTIAFEVEWNEDVIDFTWEPDGEPTYVPYGSTSVIYDSGEGGLESVDASGASFVDDHGFVSYDNPDITLREEEVLELLQCSEADLNSLVDEASSHVERNVDVYLEEWYYDNPPEKPEYEPDYDDWYDYDRYDENIKRKTTTSDFLDLYEKLTKLTEAHIDIWDYKDDIEALLEIPSYEYEAQGLNKREFIAKRKQALATKSQHKSIIKTQQPGVVIYKPILNISAEDKKAASKKFWAEVKTNNVDIDNFHVAYDEDLQKLNLLEVFNADGFLKAKGVYGLIKQADNSDWAVKALMRLWVVSYAGNGRVYSGKKEVDKINNMTWKQKVNMNLEAAGTVTWKNNYLTNLGILHNESEKTVLVLGAVNGDDDYQYELNIENIDSNNISSEDMANLILDKINSGEGRYYFISD